MIRLVLVDDHRVVRRGLRSFLEAFPDIVVVGEASSGEELLAAIAGWQADVVLLDLLMPGGCDGVETARRLQALAPQTRVVMLTAYGDSARVIAALRAGVIGYIRKDAEPELLLAAVRAAAQGQAMLDPGIAESIWQDLSREDADALTGREMEVLRLLAQGRSNPEIAESLVVSTETVKTHVGNILAKLHQTHRTQAVVHALKQGLIALEEIEV